METGCFGGKVKAFWCILLYFYINSVENKKSQFFKRNARDKTLAYLYQEKYNLNSVIGIVPREVWLKQFTTSSQNGNKASNC